MTCHTDTFARFLDVLADAIDDHDVTGAQLAARVHLSRFHLDRVIASVGGEPPAALRRRLLLERAAYRLASTDRTILDVAVEAGYGSHEAFTRAFARCFGSAPSAWRRSPTRFVVPASSNVHFHPPGSIRLPAPRKVTDMELLVRMVEHHIWLTGEFIGKAKELTDEQLDEKIDYALDDDPDVMTIRRLLSRLVGQMAMWNAQMAHRAYDFDIETHESLASLQERYDRESPVYLVHVKDAVDNGLLGDTFVDPQDDDACATTYGGMIAHVLTFAAHRRTLVCLALMKHGIDDLGWGDPAGFVGAA